MCLSCHDNVCRKNTPDCITVDGTKSWGKKKENESKKFHLFELVIQL